MLAVHPEAQKRGIGEKLIRWATDQADKENRQVSLKTDDFTYSFACVRYSEVRMYRILR